MKYIHEIIKACLSTIIIIVLIQCTEKDDFSEILRKGEWQIWKEESFQQYKKNGNGINQTYYIFRDDNTYENYFLNSKNNYPNMTGKWKYFSKDSIINFSSIKIKIIRYTNDTIFAETNMKHFEKILFIKLKDANQNPRNQ